MESEGRLAMLADAAHHGVKPAAARCDLDRKTIRAWRQRARVAEEILASLRFVVESGEIRLAAERGRGHPGRKLKHQPVGQGDHARLVEAAQLGQTRIRL